MKGKIKVLVLSPDKAPEVREIKDDMDQIRSIVGGYVEAHYWTIGGYENNGGWDTAILCDEDGKLKGKPFCIAIGPHVFVGTIILASRKGAILESLEEKKITRWTAEWHEQHKKETNDND